MSKNATPNAEGDAEHPIKVEEDIQAVEILSAVNNDAKRSAFSINDSLNPQKNKEAPTTSSRARRSFKQFNLTAPVPLFAKHIFGLRQNVVGRIHFTARNEIIYPVEGVLVFHDFVKKKQTLMKLSEDTDPVIIIMSRNRKYIAVLEETKLSQKSRISIYNIDALQMESQIPLPADMTAHEIRQMMFVGDMKNIALLTKPPDERIYMISVEDPEQPISEGHPKIGMASTNISVRCIVSNPKNPDELLCCGNNLLKFMARKHAKGAMSNNFHHGKVLDCKFHLVSMTYITDELILAGTLNTKLLVINEEGIQLQMPAADIEFLDLAKTQKELDIELISLAPNEFELLDAGVRNLICFPRGFLFVIFNNVFIFEKNGPVTFERKTILTIPVNIYPIVTYQITNLTLDNNYETIAVTAQHSQIYIGTVIVPETIKVRQLDFEPLGGLIHIDSIIDMSVCCWKPIVATASKDRTVRIWNYETGELELLRKYKVDVNLVELHSTGLTVAVGFNDQIRHNAIYLKEFNIIKIYNFSDVKVIKFSNLGHFMAAAYFFSIVIISINLQEVVTTLRDHTSRILSLAWTENDLYLISGDYRGTLIVRNTSDWTIHHTIQQRKDIQFQSIGVSWTQDPFFIVAATNHGNIRVYRNGKFSKEIVPNPTQDNSLKSLTSICLLRNDRLMFTADEAGHLYQIENPFDKNYNPPRGYSFFSSRINKMCFSYDGSLLLVATDNGTLAIFMLQTAADKLPSIDPGLLKCQDVLVSRTILEEKNQQIMELEKKIRKDAEDFNFRISQSESSDLAYLNEVHSTYCQAIADLQEKRIESKAGHKMQMLQIGLQVDEIKQEHRKELKNVSDEYSNRLLLECTKFSRLRQEVFRLQDEYREKIKISQGTINDTTRELEYDYKRQLAERENLMRELVSMSQTTKQEFLDYCRKAAEDNYRAVIAFKSDYEQKLSKELSELDFWQDRFEFVTEEYNSVMEEKKNLIVDIAKTEELYYELKAEIVKLQNDLLTLQDDVKQRDASIAEKEQRTQDLIRKNRVLEKYNFVLKLQTEELKSQLEPRKARVIDKRKFIKELQKELNDLQESKAQLQVQLIEAKEAVCTHEKELKDEKHRYRAARNYLTQLSIDIYEMDKYTESPQLLKRKIVELFNRHKNPDELKSYTSFDPIISDPLQKQRAQMEAIMYRLRHQKKKQFVPSKQYMGLFNENCALMTQIFEVKEENRNSQEIISKIINRIASSKNSLS